MEKGSGTIIQQTDGDRGSFDSLEIYSLSNRDAFHEGISQNPDA